MPKKKINDHHPEYRLRTDWLKLQFIKGAPIEWNTKGYVMKLVMDRRRKRYDWIGLPERIVATNPDVFELVSQMPVVACPECRVEQEDFDGFGVMYCKWCGYCTHSSITDGKCDYCKRKVSV